MTEIHVCAGKDCFIQDIFAAKQKTFCTTFSHEFFLSKNPALGRKVYLRETRLSGESSFFNCLSPLLSLPLPTVSVNIEVVGIAEINRRLRDYV